MKRFLRTLACISILLTGVMADVAPPPPLASFAVGELLFRVM